MNQDTEKYRVGMHHKLQHLIHLLEDAHAQYLQSPRLQANQEHLAAWFPRRIAQMKKHGAAASDPASAYSAARLLDQGSTAHLFEGNFDWYKGGDIRKTARDIGVLADAYGALEENDPSQNDFCEDADLILNQK